MRPVARRRARQLATRADLLLVNLGSGSRLVDGWKNVDLAGMGADLAWDLRRALPFPPGSVDGVLLEHVLEHFTAAEALALVSRVHAVLKPGGVLRASVPDFGRYMQSYAGDAQFVHQNRPERPTLLLAVAEVITCHGHRSAWDGETLCSVLREVGFTECAERAFGDSHFEPAPDAPDRKLESLYVEGVKAG